MTKAFQAPRLKSSAPVVVGRIPTHRERDDAYRDDAATLAELPERRGEANACRGAYRAK
jgi:hypothetical protein